MDPLSQDITDDDRVYAAELFAKLDGKPLSEWLGILARAFRQHRYELLVAQSASPAEGVEPVALWRMSDWDGWHYAVPPCAVSDEEMRRIGWEPLFASPPVAEAGDAGGEYELLPPYKLAEAFKCGVPQAKAAIEHLGYLYRQLASPSPRPEAETASGVDTLEQIRERCAEIAEKYQRQWLDLLKRKNHPVVVAKWAGAEEACGEIAAAIRALRQTGEKGR